jgi:nitrogenase molybdenum-cofactor synthesis protein NifE
METIFKFRYAFISESREFIIMLNNLRSFYKDRYLHGGLPYAHEFTPSGKIAGAILAVTSIKGAIAILHGSEGCGFHYKYLCRRIRLPAYELQCTGLNEKDIIMGGSGKLRETILSAFEKYHPSLIAVIPGVSVDIIHDDMESVIYELQSSLNCRLISIRSEGISHVDKRSRGIKACRRPGDQCDHELVSDAKLKNCGFSEAMKSIVMNLMKPQAVRKRSVNICGLWGAADSSLIGGIVSELERSGIAINSFIPSCTLEEIEKAPRAELNIITRRMNWAVKMKELFGTEYFILDCNEYKYRGADGMKDLYSEIMKKLEMGGESLNRLEKSKKNIDRILSDHGFSFGGYDAVLCCSNYMNLSKSLDFYSKTLKMKIACIFIRTSITGYASVYRKDELTGIISDFCGTLLDENTDVFIDPPSEIIKSRFDDADLIVGSGCFVTKDKRSKFIEEPEFIPLDFDNYGSFLAGYAERIKTNLNKRTNQVDAGIECRIHDENVSGAIRLWDDLWIKRGVMKR